MNHNVSHYRLLEKVGEGGMGVVYKAEDTKLKRTVALKFLPPELTRDSQAKARFLREAQAAAALDHPNICTIHEINEAEGQTYIAMAYVEGKSLKEKLAEGPLPVPEALDIAVQVAEGLKRAHDRGVIHRDIKPGNIMLTEEGRAKVMDFGLAKLEHGPDVTKTLTVMGTIAYMSPEQARGEAVDQRTDIWSFGAMLYETLTGQMPFGRKQDQTLIYSILNDAPEPPSRLRGEIPNPLDRIVQKSLEKDRSRRYQNMGELLKDLEAARASGLAPLKVEKSIIVLPFEDMSPGKDNEYFSDGMTEEIITDLSHVHDLLVISRSSAMTFKGTKKKIKDIAQDVNVRYVLEGSVRKAGNNLRITAQLIDALSDAHIWAEKYSGTLEDVFDIQEKVSRSIVEALCLKLKPEEEKKIAERPIADVTAYEYLLKAKAEILKFTVEAVNLAIRYLQGALDIVGDNALLYSGLALAYWQLANIGVQGEDSAARSEEFIKKALAIDPHLAQAHALRGWLYYLKGNTREILSHSRKALSLSPDEPLALQGLVISLAVLSGRASEAAPFAERLQKIDPLDPMTAWIMGGRHFYDGHYDRALDGFQKFYDIYPDNVVAQYWVSLALAHCGQPERSISMVDELAGAMPNSIHAKYGLLLKYGLNQDPEKLSAVLSPLEFYQYLRGIGQFSYHVSTFLSLAQRREEALDWLENAVNRGFINYPLMAEKDPWLANIRGEPRFQKLMERVKYEWEHFEV